MNTLTLHSVFRLPVLVCALVPMSVLAQAMELDSTTALTPHKVAIASTEHDGVAALHVSDAGEFAGNNEDKLVLVEGSEFTNGTIEVRLAGAPGAHAGADARGFVGVAFRSAEDASTFEAFYLRPTNGRADDQLRRNHSAQYISFPDWPWHRLREETPGLYETYVDLVPGEWTDVRIVVDGARAELYVHGADQPSIIVKDLKLGERAGAIGLWIGPGTDAYFSQLTITGAE